jgi:WASH complex subunit strumpellin
MFLNSQSQMCNKNGFIFPLYKLNRVLYVLCCSAVLSEIKAHYRDPANKSYPSEDSALLPELANYLDWTGESEPLSKIYVTTRRMNYLSLLMFLFSVAQLGKLQYSKHTTGLVSKQGGMDGPALIIGIYTILHQFHPDVLQQLLVYFSQLTRSYHEAGMQ